MRRDTLPSRSEPGRHKQPPRQPIRDMIFPPALLATPAAHTILPVLLFGWLRTSQKHLDKI